MDEAKPSSRCRRRAGQFLEDRGESFVTPQWARTASDHLAAPRSGVSTSYFRAGIGALACPRTRIRATGARPSATRLPAHLALPFVEVECLEGRGWRARGWYPILVRRTYDLAEPLAHVELCVLYRNALVVLRCAAGFPGG